MIGPYLGSLMIDVYIFIFYKDFGFAMLQQLTTIYKTASLTLHEAFVIITIIIVFVSSIG